MRGAIDLGALAQARQAQSAANSALANAPSGVVIDVDENDFQQKVIDASNQVPVVVDLWAEWCGPCKQLSPVFEKIAAEFNGKFILAKVDIDKNQNIAAAFQVQSIPAVFAIIAGSAAPLFQGAMPESQVRQVLTEVIRIANEQGVKGTVNQVEQQDEQENKVEEPQIDPKLEAAFNAIEKGNFSEAFRSMLKNTEIIELHEPEQIIPAYEKSLSREDGVSTILVEFADYSKTK